MSKKSREVFTGHLDAICEESDRIDDLLMQLEADHYDWSKEAKANEVLRRAGIVPGVGDAALKAGMQKMPYWAQDTRNYIDLALAIAAALNADKGNK